MRKRGEKHGIGSVFQSPLPLWGRGLGPLALRSAE